MPKNESKLDVHEWLVLASWRYAVIFSLFLTTSMWLLAGLWIWIRDGGLNDVKFLLVTWAFTNAVLIPTIKWDNSRR